MPNSPVTKADLDALDSRLTLQEEKLDRVITLLAKIEGASWLIKTIFYIIAPLAGAAYWLKDHVKI